MHRPRVELFRLVDWVQVCSINKDHVAGRLSLQGDKGLVTLICLASVIPVAVMAAVVLNLEVRRGGEMLESGKDKRLLCRVYGMWEVICGMP